MTGQVYHTVRDLYPNMGYGSIPTTQEIGTPEPTEQAIYSQTDGAAVAVTPGQKNMVWLWVAVIVVFIFMFGK